MSKITKKATQWRVYKPNKSNAGSASRLELKIISDEKEGREGKKFNTRDVELYWVATKQTGVDGNGNASFAWADDAKSVTLKIGETDIGEFLAVLNNKKPIAGVVDGKFKGIYHQNDKGSTSFVLEKNDNGYNVRAAKKIGQNTPIIITHQITVGEGEILKVLLELAVKQTYQW